MKKLCTLLLVLASITGYTQEAELPREVKSAFETKYQATRILGWWEDNQLYYLDFNFNGGSYTAIFDLQGACLETAETISEMEIPGDLNAYLRSNFPSGKVSFCEKVEKPGMGLFLRVTLLDAGNVERVIKSDLDGKNCVLQAPNP